MKRLITAAFLALSACGTAPAAGSQGSDPVATPQKVCTGSINGYSVRYEAYANFPTVYAVGCFGDDGCVNSDDATVQYTAFSKGALLHSWSMAPTVDGRVRVELSQADLGGVESTQYIYCAR